jgi:hypothetical protein
MLHYTTRKNTNYGDAKHAKYDETNAETPTKDRPSAGGTGT